MLCGKMRTIVYSRSFERTMTGRLSFVADLRKQGVDHMNYEMRLERAGGGYP